MYSPYIYSLMLVNRPKLFDLLMKQFWYRNALIDWYDSINCNKESVIELGCGPGALLAHISQSAGQATGIDSSEDMIKFFRKRNPTSAAKTHVANALRAEAFPEKQYNLILASSLINVVNDRPKLIQNCIDHAAQNGFVSFFFPSEKMSRKNADIFSEKHGLTSLSKQLLSTWASNAKKIQAEQLVELLPKSVTNSVSVKHYLDQMASSLTFSVN